ncbi:AAA family ATPase [Rathayibacter sp. YIM 133350]|uniref:ATP-binding protein n=1 Tax=Rathayibacter sp. YIM 133350 TaxID=3131992 RepID=UPI00307F817D
MLVERDAVLGDLVGLVDEALTGTGGLVFVGGEAGVGKSALVRALASAVTDRVRVRTGGVDNVTTADALSAFRDALPELDAHLSVHGDRVGVFRWLRSQLAEEPTLLVLEDLHWADEATLDALRFLGRRLGGTPTLLVVTYRDDEVSPRHPLAAVMGDLAGQPGVRRILVPPLSVAGVAALIEQAQVPLDPLSLHGRTAGNAFFVTEVLAGGRNELPATVRDAVLARASRLSSPASDVVAAAAILGTEGSLDLLAAVAGQAVTAVQEPLDVGILVEHGDGSVGFRHELGRESIELGLSAIRRRQLHRRALHELSRRMPEDHRRLAHHAAGCGDEAAALAQATLAARQAARLGAHREAAAQLRVALHFGGSGPDRAALFEALSYECYLTDQLPEAIAARRQALEAHQVAQRMRETGDAERWLSRLSWFLGRGDDAERYAARAVATLEPLGDSHELAMALSNMAQVRMLAKDDDEAIAWGERALALAHRLGDAEVEAHALNNIGTAQLSSGREEEGAGNLGRSLRLSLDSDLHEHAARAYTNLGTMSVEQRRLHEALRILEEGVAYCTERDLDSWSRYMMAWQADALQQLGRWEEATATGRAVLATRDLAPISAIPAAASVARIEARRGLDASDHLTIALSLAERTGELQRIAPAACAAAEIAWLAGRDGDIGSLTDEAWASALRHDDPWAVGELAWWRTIGGDSTVQADGCAKPFALMVGGSWKQAAEAWDAVGAPLWAAYACAFDADVEVAQSAVRALEALGATAAVEAMLRTRRDRGLPLPRRPRGASRTNPAQLTARELDVLGLLAEGLSTADIADRLVLSPRTVEHHIAAVLRKLDAPTRGRAVAAARRTGVLTGG